MSYPVTRHRFTVVEYHQMIANGILTREDRVELLNGEVVEMSPISPTHASAVKLINKFFQRRVDDSVIVSVQDPIQLDDYSEPQPDIALLKARSDFYKLSHPQAHDILLVIEVAESSAVRDRVLKAPAYARALIAELWIVDLQQDLIEVYHSPLNGVYQVKRQAQRGGTLMPQLLPTLSVPTDEMLG